MTFRICRSFEISCSHRLCDSLKTRQENDKIYGKCANEPSHGHNYQVLLTLKSDKLYDGMLKNFSTVKEVFKRLIEDKYDHKFLNDLMHEIPTAEHMCFIFYAHLKEELPELESVRIYETANCWAEFEEEN